MAEPSVRVVVLGARVVARQFRAYVQIRLGAEKTASKLARELDETVRASRAKLAEAQAMRRSA